MSDPVLRLETVTTSFGNLAAVEGISFSAAAGETVALLGPSGCGKTTTLPLIAGFEHPDSGSIDIGGETMIGKRPCERNLGLLFQHYALFPHMTEAENIGYGRKHRHWPKPEIAAPIEEMLDLVQLSGFGPRRPQHLSGSASPSPGCWRPNLDWCCWTSPCPRWTPNCARNCGWS